MEEKPAEEVAATADRRARGDRQGQEGGGGRRGQGREGEGREGREAGEEGEEVGRAAGASGSAIRARATQRTRHNVGWRVLAALAARWKRASAREHAAVPDAERAKSRVATVELMQPLTFMNLSGEALANWLERHPIAEPELLVVSDDVYLPVGTLRLRPRGSSGGHRGLESIEAGARRRATSRGCASASGRRSAARAAGARAGGVRAGGRGGDRGGDSPGRRRGGVLGRPRASTPP